MIWAVVLIILLVGYVFFYNQLIKLDALTQEGWSGIDVQLKRRSDLIPNLIKTVEGYTSYEQNLLQKIVNLRNLAQKTTDVKEQQTTENELGKELKQLFALAENYPELKADTQFIQLQENLSEIESDLQNARRYYNATIRDYNVALHTIPSCWIAKSLNASEKSFFTINENERQNVEIDFKSSS